MRGVDVQLGLEVEFDRLVIGAPGSSKNQGIGCKPCESAPPERQIAPDQTLDVSCGVFHRSPQLIPAQRPEAEGELSAGKEMRVGPESEKIERSEPCDRRAGYGT